MMMAMPKVNPKTHQSIGTKLVKYNKSNPVHPVGGPGKTGIKEPIIPIIISKNPVMSKKVSIYFLEFNITYDKYTKTMQRFFVRLFDRFIGYLLHLKILLSLNSIKEYDMKHLKIGNQAPAFTANDQDGNTIKLTDFKGKKLILFFYPKASTPGCTMEAKNLRDNYKSLLDQGYAVVGVSADSAKRQKNFCVKNELPFPLVADEGKEVILAYGVWGLKKFMGREYDGIHRMTFVINEKGIIENIIEKVKTKDHTNQILEFKPLD